MQPLFCISAPRSSWYGYKLRNMQTNAIRRTSQRATTVRDWMVEKANYLNTWYNEKSDFYSVQGNFSCNDLLAQEKFLSLPSETNDESSSRIEHRSLLSIRCRAFFMPSLYRTGGCRSVNLLGPVRVKSSFVSSGMCSRFSVSPRPAAPGMETNDEIMQTNAIMRNGQRTATVRDWMVEKANYLNTWYNEKSDFYSVQGNFSCNDLLAQEKFLSLPSLTNHDLSCRIEHRLLLSINRRAFFMPSLYRIGGCHSVNQYCSVRRSRDL